MNKELQKRMYFFVPYNISPIQQAIQAGHAAVEYARIYGATELFNDFAKNWKTWIILNGGTTNEGDINPGTLQEIRDSIYEFNNSKSIENEIDFTTFHEPDLNDALTAVCFICDERVFNYEDYPDFHDWIPIQDIVNDDEKYASYTNVKLNTPEELKKIFPGMYPIWISFLGGDKNVFLRQLLKGKKLA